MKDNTYISDDIMEAAEKVFGVKGQYIDIHNLDPTHRKILLICEDHPKAINDRPYLLAKFYENDWDNSKTLYENFTRLTRPETVARRFRDLREWGYVKQSKEADTYNYQAMKSERDRHSPIPPPLKYEPVTVNGERVMKVVNDLVDSVKPEQVSLI